MRAPEKLYYDLFLGLALRSGGAVSGFVLSWLMARIYGAEIVGAYQIGLTTAALASLIVSMGLEILLVRDLGPLLKKNEFADAKIILRKSLRHVLWAGFAFAGLVALLAVPLGRFVVGEPAAVTFIVVMAPIVLLNPLLKLFNALLRTNGDVKISQTLEGIFYTTFTTLILAVAWAMGATGFVALPAIAYVVGYVLAVAISGAFVRRVTRDWPKGGEAKLDLHAGARIVAAPFVTQGGDWLVLLLIAAMGTLAEAGIYRIAFVIGQLYQLINASFAVMAGPHLSRAVGEAQMRAVRHIVRTAGLIGFALSLPLTVICLLAPEQLLALFGQQFVQGAMALAIFAVAQTLNVSVGPAGTALIMLRRENLVLVLEIVATGASLLVAVTTFAQLGLAGPALGVLVASAIRNLGSLAALLATTRRKGA